MEVMRGSLKINLTLFPNGQFSYPIGAINNH